MIKDYKNWRLRDTRQERGKLLHNVNFNAQNHTTSQTSTNCTDNWLWRSIRPWQCVLPLVCWLDECVSCSTTDCVWGWLVTTRGRRLPTPHRGQHRQAGANQDYHNKVYTSALQTVQHQIYKQQTSSEAFTKIFPSTFCLTTLNIYTSIHLLIPTRPWQYW